MLFRSDAAGVIQDLAGNDMLGFSGLTADTLRSAFDVTVLNASYRDLVLTTDPLMPPARIGTGNANSNTITVNQPVAVDNVIDGRGGVDTMDGGLGNDIYLVTDPTHHAVGEVNDSGGDAEDELRFAGIAPGTLQVFSNDIGLDKVTIGTGTGPTPIPTALALNIDASAAPNGLRIFGSTGANMLRGSQHPDLLEGGDGVDRMEGGIGNDVYVVNRRLHHGAPEIWDVSGTTDELRFTSTTPGDILVVQRGLGVGGTAGIEQVVIRDDLIPTTSMGPGIGTHQLGIDARLSVEALTIMGNAGRNIIWGTPLVDQLNGGPDNDLYMIPSAAHHAAAEINDGSGVDELRFSQTSTLGVPDTLTLFAGDTGLETVNIATGTSPTPDFTGTTALNVDAMAVLTSLSITGNNGPNRILGTGPR